MRTTRPLSAAIFCLLAIAACEKNKRDIRSFYFPIEELTEETIYEYQSLQGDTSNREYWIYQSVQTDSGTFLVGKFYDRNEQIGQSLREKIVSNGSLARELLLYEPDYQAERIVKIRANIESQNVFPFEVSDSLGLFLYKLNYKIPADTTAKIFLVRNRRFGGDAPDFVFKGKKHRCIRFSLKEVVGSEGEGTAESEANGEEWYAEGIGLVHFRKIYGSEDSQMVREFRLVDVYKK